MKPLKYISLVAIAFLCFQCSSDDNSSDLVQDSTLDDFLLGDWTVEGMSLEGFITLDEDYLTTHYRDYEWGWEFNPYPIPIKGKMDTQNYFITFYNLPNKVSSNGIVKASYDAYVDDGQNGYTFSKDIGNIDFFKDGNWSFKPDFSNLITINSNNLNEDYYFKSLSKNEFIILKELKDKIVLKSDELEIPCSVNLGVFLKFKKR